MSEYINPTDRSGPDGYVADPLGGGGREGGGGGVGGSGWVGVGVAVTELSEMVFASKLRGKEEEGVEGKGRGEEEGELLFLAVVALAASTVELPNR